MTATGGPPTSVSATGGPQTSAPATGSSSFAPSGFAPLAGNTFNFSNNGSGNQIVEETQNISNLRIDPNSNNDSLSSDYMTQEMLSEIQREQEPLKNNDEIEWKSPKRFASAKKAAQYLSDSYNLNISTRFDTLRCDSVSNLDEIFNNNSNCVSNFDVNFDDISNFNDNSNSDVITDFVPNDDENIVFDNDCNNENTDYFSINDSIIDVGCKNDNSFASDNLDLCDYENAKSNSLYKGHGGEDYVSFLNEKDASKFHVTYIYLRAL